MNLQENFSNKIQKRNEWFESLKQVEEPLFSAKQVEGPLLADKNNNVIYWFEIEKLAIINYKKEYCLINPITPGMTIEDIQSPDVIEQFKEVIKMNQFQILEFLNQTDCLS